MSHRDRYEVLVLTPVRYTDKAVCVREEDGKECWLPFSQIRDPDERYIRECEGQLVEIEIPNWLAEEKGLL